MSWHPGHLSPWEVGRSFPVFLTPPFCLLMPASSLPTIAINPEKNIGYPDYMHSAYGEEV